MLSATSSFQLIQSFTAECIQTPFGTLKTRRPYRNSREILGNGTPLTVAADLKSTASLFFQLDNEIPV